MKRGKDEEKVMGPMFPRLHVNDTDKGGPRAPPRNKMALYEQLSIPSQRYNHGMLPLNPNSKSNLVPAASSSQGSSLERNMHFPRQATLTRMDEKYQSRPSDGVNLGAQLAQLEQKNKVSDEDDFMVPVFVETEKDQDQSKTQNAIDGEKIAPVSPSYSRRSMKLQDTSERDSKLISSPRLNLRQEVGFQSQEKPNVCVSDTGHQSHPVANVTCLQNESRTGAVPQTIHGGCIDECIGNIEMDSTQRPSSNSCTECLHSSPKEPNNERDYLEDKRVGSLRGDASETSMVDSISGLDISPDDVVGIIGQKHFWKARRAIVNQQRVFAVQVFELHRLIKVQRIIAGSPHLLLEDSAYAGQPSLKGSSVKKRPAEYAATPPPPPRMLKRSGDFEKSNHRMECSAENAVGKPSLSSIKNVNHPLNDKHYVGNPPPSPVASDPKTGPWPFHQPAGQQWLIPVMTPSEGLVYKPYPGPGFTGTACRGYAPLGPTPFVGNFMTPNYGVPASHYPHNQGIGISPGAPPAGHFYFPPFSMPVIHPAMSGSAVEQINGFAGPGSHGQSVQRSSGEANYNKQHESSCEVPTQKNKATSQAMKSQMSKGSEVQGSTGSSPAARTQGDSMGRTTNGRDVLPLFPMAPVDQERVPQSNNTGQPTRAIKVVPHNRRSATESVARIFQSIQERNQ